MEWPVEEGVCQLIGKLGRGVPRFALRLLSASREVCRSRNETLISIEDCQYALTLEGKDSVLGLDRTERQMLTMLDEAGGPIRLGVLASRLGRSAATISDAEHYLLRCGLSQRTEKGRIITAEGVEYLRYGNVADVEASR